MYHYPFSIKSNLGGQKRIARQYVSMMNLEADMGPIYDEHSFWNKTTVYSDINIVFLKLYNYVFL